jgi:hypothetical protein
MHKRHARQAVLGMITFLAPLSIPLTANATSIADLSTAQMTDAAVYIVEGTIDSVWTEVDNRGLVWTRARVLVSATHKGIDSPAELIVDSMGGIHPDGRATNMPSSARFSEGEDVFLFLDTIKEGTRLVPIANFHGKYTVRRAPGTESKIVQRWHSTNFTHYDGRFLPFPAAGDRTYHTDLISDVNERLDTGWDGAAIPGISNTELLEINTLERRKRQ